MVKEKFLIDSNIFITPYQNFYPFDIAPSFWNQLKNKLALDEVSVLDVVRDEVIAGDDELSDWLKQIQGMHILSRKDPQILQEYTKVLSYLQNDPHYTERALRAWSMESIADPWLIAAAKAYDYTIITLEASAVRSRLPAANLKFPLLALHSASGVKISSTL